MFNFSVFKDVIKTISGGTARFLDLAGKFDKAEIESLMSKMEETKRGYFKRGKTIIISDEALKYLAQAKMKKEEIENDPYSTTN